MANRTQQNPVVSSDEWYTPRWVIDELGPFDLDPCAPMQPPYEIAPLSFNVGSYFYIQEDLKRYISELAVNDPQWNELKKLHSRKDYLGMIGVLKKEKLREYPSKEEIKSLYL